MKSMLSLSLMLALMSAAPTASAESETEDGPLGSYVGGGVGGVVQGDTIGEVIVGHWWNNFAVEGGLSYFKTKLELEGDGVEAIGNKSHALRLGVAAKAGQAIGRVKPYMKFGIRYELFKNNSDFQPRVKGDIVYVVPAVGVDIRVADHVMLGFVVVSVPFIVDGDRRVKGFSGADADFDGSDINVLSSFSVSYLF